VGTGFSAADREHLMDLLRRDARKTSPFVPTSAVKEPSVHFVRPHYVGEVRFSEWTAAGHLRHPTWRGLRDDKVPAQVMAEA
jgi:bifunctional non-homologous end joining protein LigD